MCNKNRGKAEFDWDEKFGQWLAVLLMMLRGCGFCGALLGS